MGAELGVGVLQEKVCALRGFVRMVGSRRSNCDGFGVLVCMLFFFVGEADHAECA